jgi:hypothetical protein
MTRPRPRAAIATAVTLATGVATLAAGCASAATAANRAATPAAPSGPPALQTSLVTAAGTWAVVVMGYAAGHNNFWQLFNRPALGTRWRLVTPPGVADNGGLALADAGGRSLITAFRPSQYLAFTPLTATSDDGRSWSSGNPIDAALAGVPDALAAAPGGGQLLALLADGTARTAARGGLRWNTLTSQRSLAGTAPGRRCGLLALTAAAFSPSGMPLLAGACGHPGTAGIFARSGGGWRAAGPALPAALARRTITVLRLTRTASATVALLAARTGPAVSLLVAWSSGSGSTWTLSPPVSLNGAHLASASFGPGGTSAIVLTGGRGQVIAGAGSSWRSVPALPAGTATLAPGPAGAFDALAVHRGTLTVWQLTPGSAAWARTQAVNVPIQYGSSA